MTYQIIPDHATLGSKRRPGTKLASVVFLVAHDTGNPGASARNHARWYRNDPNPPAGMISSAHLFVDDTEIIETIPCLPGVAEVAYHVLKSKDVDNKMFGHDANAAAVGVEYCFGGNIDADEAYSRYVWVLADLCRQHNLDPATRIVGHHVLDPGRKVDPPAGLSVSGRTYEELLTDVVAEFPRVGGTANTVGSARIKPGPARVTVNLKRRQVAAPTGPFNGLLSPGATVNVQGVVKGTPVMGIDDWCQLPGAEFCWAGGLVQP